MTYSHRRVSMSRMLLGITLLAVWCTTARAQLDPEKGTPYNLQVVLHVEEHRLLTTVFVDRVRNELSGSLRAALGNLAQVDVVIKHPLLDEVRRDGLQHALDGWHFVNEAKIHFVLLSF